VEKGNTIKGRRAMSATLRFHRKGKKKCKVRDGEEDGGRGL